MPTNPRIKTVSPLRVAAGLATLLTLGALAPTAASASILDGSASVEVNIVEREGYQQGVHALVFLRSAHGVPIEGDLTLTVNGVIRKVEPVATDSLTVVDIFLGPMQAPITACATFGGVFWLGGDNYRSTQATGCDHVAAAPTPGFRTPMRARPSAPREDFRLRR